VGLSGRVKSLGGEMCQNSTALFTKSSTSSMKARYQKVGGKISPSSSPATPNIGGAKRISALIIIAIIGFFMMTGMGEAQEIDYNIIATIESSNSAYAYNSKTQATGLYQITPICLKEWNDYHRDDQYCMNALFDWVINRKIASWYLEIRIPRMLKYYNVPITLDNILWAYNAGIGNVVKGRMPKETKDYIKKYHKLEEVLK